MPLGRTEGAVASTTGMDRPPSAPPVVAVIVASEPGPWFEDVLTSFGSQDYPNLSVLVVDGSQTTDPTPRVASALPDAYVRRVGGGGTFAALANDALETVQGAAFLAFCHDDVAPDPDAIRRMVEEAFRSNAAVVAPKVVDWDRPERLLDVGFKVDKTGATAPVVDAGELDQEQHDAVRDVFAVSNTCMLVRSDLFSALGGFDVTMGDHGADVDFCWRAQVAGGRVLVAPAARVRHRRGTAAEASPQARADEQRLGRRHHLRSMLKSYSRLHLLRVLPQAIVVTLVEIVLALAGRRWAEARQLPSAWFWNLRRSRELRPLRRATQRSRAVPDADVRRLQVRGSVRLSSYLRSRLHADDKAEALVAAGQRLAGSVGRGPAQAAAIVAAVLAVVALIGSRDLITGRITGVGELAPLPQVGELFSHWLSGWRTTGLGASSPAPTAFGLLGLAGVLLAGKVALLQTVLVLGAWPAAGVGTWRLTRPLGPTLARLVAVIAYLAVPLSYGALARGRLGGLLAWAALPWLLLIVARLSGLAPFGRGDDGVEGRPASRQWAEVVKLAILLAVVGALVPSVALALVVATLGILAGSLLAGGTAGASRALAGTVVAVVLALGLHVPWSFDLLLPGGWGTVVGVGPDPAGAPGLGQLLRFQVGPLGAAPLGWAFLVAAALPLFIGKGWRLAWAVRCWTTALACVLFAWAGGRGWSPVRLESPDVLLAPAALALALAAALGAAAFELDLPGYRFGWRQVASLVAGVAVVVGVLPVVGGARNGRWHLTREDVARSLEWMAPAPGEGGFRVLWLGAPEALPLDGWDLGGGLAYATSRSGAPDATDLLPGAPSGATREIAASVRLAEAGDTARLGRLLAPMAVRYIVVPVELETGRATVGTYAVRDTLRRALVSQVDLRLLPSDPAVAVYENTSWGALRTQLPERLTGPVPTELGPGADLTGSQPVLAGEGPARFSGPLPTDRAVLVAESPSARWALSVGGVDAGRQDAYGVANVFRPGSPGEATLRYRTPVVRYGLLALQVVLWALAFRALIGLRRRAADEEGGYR